MMNLGSYVTGKASDFMCWVGPGNLNKSLVLTETYPEVETALSCVMQKTADLFNAPADFVGIPTIGSSEAVMLALLAHKWAWKAKHRPGPPNLVMGANVHACWHKFARYFDVEERIVPLSPDKYTLDVQKAKALVDENTICVGAVLGSTMTGELDDVAELDRAVDGLDVPIHVDAAIGGFVVPFVNCCLEWDFRLKNVKTINVSNHKYGMVPPGLGTLICRDESVISRDLYVGIDYLEKPMFNYGLNFSRNAMNILIQHNIFLRLGTGWYLETMRRFLSIAACIEYRLKTMGCFDLVNKSGEIPVVAFTSNGVSLKTLSEKLRRRGWILPVYSMPASAESVEMSRIVVRETLPLNDADRLCKDIEACLREM